MKKSLFPIICSLLVFTSCDNNSQEPSQNNYNDANEFIGEWVADNVNIAWALQEADDYYWRYLELNDELETYYRQGDWEKISQLENQINNLQEEYKDDYVGSCDVIDIEKGIIKIGRADLYLNPTSKDNCWLWNNAFTSYDMGFEISLVVEDWETYRYTMQDGSLYFNNGQDCIFSNSGKLIWEGVTDFMSALDFLSLIVE